MDATQFGKATAVLRNSIAETREQLAWFTKIVTPADSEAAYLKALRERIAVDEAWLKHFEAKG